MNELNLSTRYYDLIRPKAPVEQYDFYRDYAINAGGKILEPMCGSGRFLIPMLIEGLNIEGFDYCESMLESLRLKSSRLELYPNIWKSSIESVNLNKIYNLIFIPCGSIGVITDLVIMEDILRNFYNHLIKNGKLVFELETINSLPERGVWRDNKALLPDNKTIVCRNFITLRNDICRSLAKYELRGNNKVINSETESFEIRIYNDEKIIKDILYKIGFKKVNVFKSFYKERRLENNKIFIYECVK